MTEQKKNIVDTAMAAGSFTTLAKALTAAGLVDTLKGAGPFTVFAPNDAAFAKLPAGTLDALINAPSKEKLIALLKLHVISGKVMSAEIKGKSIAPRSLQGEDLRIDGANGVTVNGSKVVTADVDCSNGVIHVIDTVIMPHAERAAA
ncbi:fasciclin domain-containing protein [Terricaulis sp.]|uniref:fasciclin domain-containing protein n=1 Tax=Terricaulis sp. TaxID=2768686 RepID=UPI002AC7DC1E|nr:fasciclin domain-containing protein [Terricaulis sp.]MDZ4691882.1 fasciclin domain-containing protein [Terricaulis sp.]